MRCRAFLRGYVRRENVYIKYFSEDIYEYKRI